MQLGVGSLAQDKRQAVFFAHLVDLRGAEVRVAPQGDLHLGPRLPDRRENAPQNRCRFAPLDATTPAQNRRNQAPRVPFVEVHGHVAVFFMVGVEQRQLLRPMGDVLGVIDVEDDLLGRLRVGCDKRVQQRARKAVEIATADPVFQTRQGRLTGQIRARQRRPLAGGFQPRITAQIVAVVGVLVAAGDLKNALAKKVRAAMVDVTGMAPIRQRRHHTLKDAGVGFGHSQKQQAPIVGGTAALEIGFDFLARDPCKRQSVMPIFHRGVLLKWVVFGSTPNLGINNHLYRGHRLFYE